MKKFKIAATGLDGLVGSRIRELLNDRYEFISFPQSVLDITDKEKVKDWYKKGAKPTRTVENLFKKEGVLSEITQ